MKKILFIFVLALFFGCTPILKPIDLQIENKENVTIDNMINYLQKLNINIINEYEPEIEERSTPIGTITIVTLETDWQDTGIFVDEYNGNGYVKYKVRFGTDVPDQIPGSMMRIDPKFGYKKDGDMVQKDKAPKNINDHINAFAKKIDQDFK